MYLCTGFSLNSYAEDTSGYIVGTYNISDWVEHKSRDEKNTSSQIEVCPYRDSSPGYRDPYVGILVPTRDPLPKGTLGNLVLHRNM